MATKIMVGYDGSDRSEDALALGRWLAEVMDARLIVAGAIHSNPLIVGLHLLAEKERADLIVVGLSHRGSVGRVMVGSTAHRLLHGAPCPVAVAPVGWCGHANTGLRSIAVGYDGAPEAQVALDYAVELAKQQGADIRIVMVAEPPPLVEEELRGQLQDAVAATSDAGIEVEGELLSGDPASKLAEAASQADLMIVGSRGYGPLSGVLLGSVSVALLDSCPSPVLVCARGDPSRRTGRSTGGRCRARGRE